MSAAGFEPATHALKGSPNLYQTTTCTSSLLHARRNKISEIQTRHCSGCPQGAQNQATPTIAVVEGEWPPFERCLGEVGGRLSSKGSGDGPRPFERLSAEQPFSFRSSDKWPSSRAGIAQPVCFRRDKSQYVISGSWMILRPTSRIRFGYEFNGKLIRNNLHAHG